VVEVKRGDPRVLRDLAELADRVFRPAAVPGTAMIREFPHVFNGENSGNIFYVEEGGVPVSMAAVKPWEVVLGPSTLSVIALGSVCTLEQHRGEGYATAIIQEVIKEFRGKASVMIVSGERGLYRRVGCRNFGSLAELQVGEGKGKGVVPLPNPEERAEELLRLHAAEMIRFKREVEGMRRMLSTLSFPRPFACSVGAFLSPLGGAYAIASLTRQGGLFIHEWAGDRAEVLSLISSVTSWYGVPEAKLLFQPRDSKMWELANGIRVRRVQNQGTILILNPERLSQEVKDFLEEEMRAELGVEKAGEGWRVGVKWRNGQTQLEFRDLGDLTQWVFNEDGLGIPFPYTAGLDYV